MNIAIVGGGLTGLAAAATLSQSSAHTIHVFESSQQLGGLAAGFWGEGWEWPLERAYHHIFASDTDIIRLLQDTNYTGITFSQPTTSSLYERDGVYQTFAIDTPLNLLRFPLIPFEDRVRTGAVLGLLKLAPHLPFFDRETTERLLVKTMGERAYETIFGQMFRKKFGKYAGNILAAFIWSRIHARTKSLGYMTGGFQSMVDHLETYCTDHGVRIHKNTPINLFEPSDSAHGPIRLISGETSSSLGVFDVVISSLPSPILASVATPVLHATEVKNLSSLRYLSALNLIVETEEPVFDKEYWVSVCVEDMPNLVFVQHTNFVSKSHYNDKHILYIAGYYEDNDPIMSLSKQQVLDLLLPQIQKVRGTQPRVGNTYVWKARHAQPVFDAQFLAHMPTMQTSHPRLLVANLDMTYPFDRGTNHAVRLGVQVAQKIPKTT